MTRENPIVVRATDLHAIALAPRLRVVDSLEIREPDDPLGIIRRSLDQSTHSWAWLVDGVPICMWGVAPKSLLGGAGWVWFVAAHEITECDLRTFLLGSRRMVDVLLAIYPTLEGYVDTRFTASVRWIRKMGFTLGVMCKHPTGVPFRHFIRER